MAEARNWLEVVAHGPCPDCGFDGTPTAAPGLADAARGAARQWAAWLRAVGSADRRLRARPQPDVWSALEYAAHVRDVWSIFEGRARVTLTEDRPNLPWWDHEA